MRELSESIHHHLRTPLTAVVGHAELLRGHADALPPGALDSVDGIVRAASRLEEVVASVCDLVDLVRGSPGDVRTVDLSGLAADEVAAWREVAASSGVHLEHVGAGAVCDADAARVGRALRALLQHAVATAGLGSRIGVSTAAADGGARLMVCCPASAGHAADELGMALLQALVKAHGGRLQVCRTSEAFTVRLDLPRARRTGVTTAG